MHLPNPTIARGASIPQTTRVDPSTGPERNPHQRVTITGRVGQGRRALVQGVRWGALMDDSPSDLMRKCRTAAALELRTQDRDAPRVIDVADRVLLWAMERASRETNGATCAPREETARMSYLRLEARKAIAELKLRETREETGTDWDALGDTQRAAQERARILSADDARTAANGAARLTETAIGGDVWHVVYDATRGASGEETARELDCTLDALKGRLKRGRATLANQYPTPGALISALLLMDDADAGSDRYHARLQWRPRDTHDATTWDDATDATLTRVGNVQMMFPLRWTWEEIRQMRTLKLASSLPMDTDDANGAHSDARPVNGAQLAFAL